LISNFGIYQEIFNIALIFIQTNCISFPDSKQLVRFTGKIND